MGDSFPVPRPNSGPYSRNPPTPEVLSTAHLERARALAARLEQELAEAETRVRLLEVQRRSMLRLLDAWEDRMQRIRDLRLLRTSLMAIEECRREVSRVIECGPPILPAPVDEDALVARRTLWICE